MHMHSQNMASGISAIPLVHICHSQQALQEVASSVIKNFSECIMLYRVSHDLHEAFSTGKYILCYNPRPLFLPRHVALLASLAVFVVCTLKQQIS